LPLRGRFHRNRLGARLRLPGVLGLRLRGRFLNTRLGVTLGILGLRLRGRFHRNRLGVTLGILGLRLRRRFLSNVVGRWPGGGFLRHSRLAVIRGGLDGVRGRGRLLGRLFGNGLFGNGLLGNGLLGNGLLGNGLADGGVAGLVDGGFGSEICCGSHGMHLIAASAACGGWTAPKPSTAQRMPSGIDRVTASRSATA
jgi:hypothetical protein